MLENQSVRFKDLMRQPSNIRVTCSAYSAFNWLRLIGAPVNLQTGQSLIDKVLTTRIPLDEQDLQGLAQKYGYKMKTYMPNEERTQINDMVADLVFILKQSPILQNISTHLSKKNRFSIPYITASNMKDTEGKLITHAVVVVKESQSQILIIDPYEPKKPEVFDISEKQEQLRFLSWIMSSYYQSQLLERRKVPNKQRVIDLAQQELSQPEKVKRGQINMFGIIQARLRYLIPDF